MRTTKTQIVPAAPNLPAPTAGRRMREIMTHHTEEILKEVAPTLRGFRTFLLVLSISIPLFFFGLIAALWHIAR